MTTFFIFALDVAFIFLTILTAQIGTGKSNMPLIFGIISCGLFVWALVRVFSHIHFFIS